MKLSRLEQETIIIFNEEEPTATIQTYNGRLKRRLEQIKQNRPNEVSHDYNGDYIIPKGWIKINPKVVLSDEERAKRAERFNR